MRLPLATVMLAALFSAAPAFAQKQSAPSVASDPNRPAPPTVFVEPVGMMIAAFDTNGDGEVTRAEFDAGLRHSFEVIDKGHHGSLSYIEFSDWAARWLGDPNALPSPFEVDVNGDNRITLEELQYRFDQFFTRFDADKDGVIRRKELLTIRASSFGGPGGQRRGGGRRDGPPGGQ